MGAKHSIHNGSVNGCDAGSPKADENLWALPSCPPFLSPLLPSYPRSSLPIPSPLPIPILPSLLVIVELLPKAAVCQVLLSLKHRGRQDRVGAISPARGSNIKQK